MNENLKTKIENFFVKGKLSTYKKGEILVRAYEEPNGVYYLQEGFVKMSSISENGTEIILNIFKAGSFFPMIWAIADKENSYFFEAMTDIKAYKLPRAEVLNFVKDNPEVLFDLTRRILVGMEGLLVNMRYFLYGSSLNRVASAILVMANRFGKKKDGEGILIGLILTHQDIASIAGITRETTSITIKSLERKGIISYIGRNIKVDNFEELQNVSFISPEEEIN